MDFPALMPKALHYCEDIPTEAKLFDLLIQKPIDFVLFFETAVADETWSASHADFVINLMDWLTVQSFNNMLPIELCRRAAKSIQAHHAVLETMVPKNIAVALKDAHIKINSLLLTAASDFFKDILPIECRDKNTNLLNLPSIPYEVFVPVETYINTGNIPDLWKKEKREIEVLLRQALAWDIESIYKECQLTLKKYINLDNAIDLLIQAQQELWHYFKKECINFINDKMPGFRLEALAGERLGFEFYDFNDATLKVFERLHLWITDLICKKSLIENVKFSSVLRKCPKLLMLDISNSFVFSEYLNDLPKDLQGISLKECTWLQQKTLKKIVEACPYLKDLILSGNYQLNFAAWGELIKLTNLKSLDLTRCHQMTDEDFITILKACLTLTDLVLDECRKIGDKGFFELAKNLTKLTSLSLEHCSISDSALLEIAARTRTLNALNLTRCDQLTEKGFKELAKHAFALKELNLSQCNVTKETIEEIRQRHPYLQIIL